MPPRYLAAVNCPACGTRFQTPVEQILDVRVDPAAKNRVLSGTVNVAVCPACGTTGAMNLPFIYHDPDEEIALLYLPVEAGSNEVERQKAAGRLTRQLMDAMPPEERKGYLLQPETFINVETLVKRVLELEGISEEDMARSQRQRELLDQMLQASEEDWPELVAEHDDLLDEGFFSFLEYVMQMAVMSEQSNEAAEQLEALHTYLVEETELGRKLARRTEIVRNFAEDPNRDTLVEALTQAPDDETLSVLVQSGIGLMDYGFFQKLIKRIDEAESSEEETKLRQLRRKILDLRDEMMAASESLAQERGRLLSNLLTTEDPVRMASSHLSEIDDLFFAILGAQLEQAQQEGDQAALEDLQRVASAVNRVMEGNMPPEIALTRRLLASTSDEQLESLLQANQDALTPRFVQFLEAVQASMVEQGQDEAAERLSEIRAKVQQRVAPSSETTARAQPAPADEAPDTESETRTPSGLIIAKH